MTGTARSNNPDGSSPADPVRRLVLPDSGKVRELQRKLWAAAKQSAKRRFHALYDRVHRGDVLWEAWRRVLTSRGTAGVDRITLAQVEEYGVERMLDELAGDLQAGSYRPTVRDRVVQQAAKLVLEPIFEADFAPVSYGFRPKRSATQAMERVRKGFIEGHTFVVEFDIRDFFDEIDHTRLVELVARRVSDRRVLKLVRMWLQAGVMVDGSVERTVAGTPQGGVLPAAIQHLPARPGHRTVLPWGGRVGALRR